MMCCHRLIDLYRLLKVRYCIAMQLFKRIQFHDNIRISPHYKTLDTDCDAKLQQKHLW